AGSKRRNGELWFPTQQGIVIVHPDRMKLSEPPPARIEAVRLDREATLLAGELKIPPSKEDLEIEYTAISFISPERTRFRYKLEGLDRDWGDAGGRRVAYYSHLPPGNYVFRLVAANRDGIWSRSEAHLAVTVLPPIWKSNIFLV